jgi:hypothetical protein
VSIAPPEELPLEIDELLASVIALAHRRDIPEELSLRPCLVHKVHKPEPLRVIRHHIWPLGMDGPDEDDNKLDICDTGHYNVHVILGLLILSRNMPHGHNAEKKIALTGFNDWVRAGKPGHPVFQLN